MREVNHWAVAPSLRQKFLAHRNVNIKALLGSHELLGEGEEKLMVAEDGRQGK